jgi:long-chain fatty acid transport protein
MRSGAGARCFLVASAVAILTLLLPRDAAASGFFLLEQSARLQGMSYAGTAALAADASTVYYNPAGMSRIKDWSFAQSGFLVAIQSELEDATATNFGQPVFGPNGSTSASAGTNGPVGATLFAKRLNDQIVVGFGLTVPFGLSFQYAPDSIARFTATKSRLASYNLSPSISYEPIEGLSFGAGFDAILGDVALNQKLQIPGLDELNVRLQAKDWTFGWNAGVLYEIDDDTRIGLAYRSKVTFGLEGTAIVTPNPLISQSQGANATTTFPDTWTLSGVTKVAPRWQLLGDLQWVHWSVIQNVAVHFTERPNNSGQILPEQNLPFAFRNTFRGALGAQYFYDDTWTFRGGVAFDQSPVTNSNRTARLPDSNRVMLSIGVGYKLMEHMDIDVGYSHIFLPWEAKLDQTGTGTTLTGDYSSSVDLFGLQFTFTFDDGIPLFGYTI